MREVGELVLVGRGTTAKGMRWREWSEMRASVVFAHQLTWG